MNITETPTTAEVIAVLFASHKADLCVFATYSNPTGECEIGNGAPEMETWYGLDGTDFPLFHLKTTWEHGEKPYVRVNEKTERWLCIGKEEK